MSRVVSTIVHALLGGFGAARYLVSLIVVLVVLGYALLTELGVVPFYVILAARVGLPPLFLLLFLYLVVLLVCCFVWYLWILHPKDSLNAQMAWRGVYRQTDRTGVWWEAILLLAAVSVVTYFAAQVFTVFLREAIVYLAVVVGLPLILDVFPVRRPRRIVASPDDRSALDIAERLLTPRDQTKHVLNSIAIYNELDPQDPKLAGPDLPDGMVIEIPPRF